MSDTEPTRNHVVRGTHREFADLYDYFLEAVYPPDDDEATGWGRWRLMRSVAAEMRARDAFRVLDCAAGTGFPALDLAADTSQRFDIHCTDGDRHMLDVLARRAGPLKVPLHRLPPPCRRNKSRAEIDTDQAVVGAMVLDWGSLNQITVPYDYVLCRGNSLAYADTWAGDRRTAPPKRIEHYLSQIAAKVRPGGYLHIDAPWQLELDREKYRTVGSVSIWEQVTAEQDCRQWELSYKLPDRTVTFKRYSSLLTIDRIESSLKEMGFEDTEPFALRAERPGFGVIIARKPG